MFTTRIQQWVRRRAQAAARWLAKLPITPNQVTVAGMLVVFIPGHCGEAGKLDFLLMAAADISKRIQAELTEAAQAGSL